MEKKYCAAPWRTLHISPQGDVRTCCASKNKSLGNVNKVPIEEIVQCNKIKEIRNTIKKGVLHAEYCKNCIESEKLSGTSERDWHNNIADDIDYNTISDTDYQLNLIDIRWNITCNMSCNYCDPSASSKWAKLKGKKDYIASEKSIKNILIFLSKHKHTIKTAALVGGEPLLLLPNEKLLELLDIRRTNINVLTNLNVSSDNKIFNKLQEFNNTVWSISFDNIGDEFEYVRYGGNWNNHINNLNILKDKTISILAVYSIYNATKLNDFISWSRKNHLEITWQLLTWPEELSVLNQNKIKDLVLDELNKVLCRNDLYDKERPFLEELLNTIIQSDNDMSNELLQHIDDIEKYHPDKKGQFKKLWPEIYNRISHG